MKRPCLLRLRDKGKHGCSSWSTSRRTIAIGRPRRRPSGPRRRHGRGGTVCFEGNRRGAAGQRQPSPAAISTTGPPFKGDGADAHRHAGDPRRDGAQPTCATSNVDIPLGGCSSWSPASPAPARARSCNGSIPAGAGVVCRWTRERSAARDGANPATYNRDCSTRSARAFAKAKRREGGAVQRQLRGAPAPQTATAFRRRLTPTWR